MLPEKQQQQTTSLIMLNLFKPITKSISYLAALCFFFTEKAEDLKEQQHLSKEAAVALKWLPVT